MKTLSASLLTALFSAVLIASSDAAHAFSPVKTFSFDEQTEKAKPQIKSLPKKLVLTKKELDNKGAINSVIGKDKTTYCHQKPCKTDAKFTSYKEPLGKKATRVLDKAELAVSPCCFKHDSYTKQSK